MELTGPAVEVKQDGFSRSDFWCWVALLFIIIGSAVIRGRLLSIPLERDEGEYAYIAQQMLNGVPPYESAYSMKLPGIYVVYALFLAVFGQTLTAIHLGLIVFNAATIFAVFWLTRRLFNPIAGVTAAACFSAMSLVNPALGLSANAEHFVLLPALIGLILMAGPPKPHKSVIVFFSGLLLGLAFIIKQHGVFFPVFGALYLLYIDFCCRPFKLTKTILDEVVFIIGAVAPFALICLFYWHIGVFDKFWFWTFTYAREYATAIPLQEAPAIFKAAFNPLFYATLPLWLFVPIGLLALVFLRRFRVHTPFVIGLIVFSFLSTCPGFYFRGHYFILLLPAVAVAAGLGFAVLFNLVRGNGSGLRRIFGGLIVFVGIASIGYLLFGQRMFLFDGDVNQVCRRIYGANPFPESLEIAKYIKQNSLPTDTIAVFGSEPQICFYSDRRSATAYIYTYPLMEVQPYALKMQKEMVEQIEKANPKYFVMANVSVSWLRRPKSDSYIFDWAGKFVQSNYTRVGVADFVAFDRTIYIWGTKAADYKPMSSVWMAVYRRNQ